MGKPQRRFTKKLEAEAVRLVETGGRTQREIADDLGTGLSTLRRWIDKPGAGDGSAASREACFAEQKRRMGLFIRTVGRPGPHQDRPCQHRLQRQTADRSRTLGRASRLIDATGGLSGSSRDMDRSQTDVGTTNPPNMAASREYFEPSSLLTSDRALLSAQVVLSRGLVIVGEHRREVSGYSGAVCTTDSPDKEPLHSPWKHVEHSV